MIIDSHVHIAEPPNDETPLSRINIDGTRTQWHGTRADASLDNLLQTMEKNQIDQAIIMGLEGIISNKHLGQVTKKNTNLHGFAWITDPKQPQSINELEEAVKKDKLVATGLRANYSPLWAPKGRLSPINSAGRVVERL